MYSNDDCLRVANFYAYLHCFLNLPTCYELFGKTDGSIKWNVLLVNNRNQVHFIRNLLKETDGLKDLETFILWHNNKNTLENMHVSMDMVIYVTNMFLEMEARFSDFSDTVFPKIKEHMEDRFVSMGYSHQAFYNGMDHQYQVGLLKWYNKQKNK